MEPESDPSCTRPVCPLREINGSKSHLVRPRSGRNCRCWVQRCRAKSTLVKIILGLHPVDRGMLIWQPGLTIGYVPQRFHVDPTLPMTVTGFPEPPPQRGQDTLTSGNNWELRNWRNNRCPNYLAGRRSAFCWPERSAMNLKVARS